VAAVSLYVLLILTLAVGLGRALARAVDRSNLEVLESLYLECADESARTLKTALARARAVPLPS
jgi:hypothetical protein